MKKLRQRLIISAPFGNYLSVHGEAVRTVGTFTLERRGGWPYRLWRIAKTLRYHRGLGARTNKLGLPNPGIAGLKRWVEDGFDVSDKIVSIKGFNCNEWINLVLACVELKPLAIELNISCPNVNDLHFDRPDQMLRRIMQAAGDVRVIVKLPPVGHEKLIEDSIDSGICMFHCCNTLAVPGGGMSGKPLKPLSINVIRFIRDNFGTDAFIIGGGGITEVKDAMDYLVAGADSVAIGSMLLNPWSKDRAREISMAVHPVVFEIAMNL